MKKARQISARFSGRGLNEESNLFYHLQTAVGQAKWSRTGKTEAVIRRAAGTSFLFTQDSRGSGTKSTTRS